MKYYMHNTNSFQDEKITELFIAFGYEGLGLFYTLLEKFALQEKPIKTAVLKKQLSVGKKLEKCWKFMESLELIYSNNGETFNENILKFTEKFQKDREKNAKRLKEWRDNQTLTPNETDSERVRNASNYTILNYTELNYTDDEEKEEEKESSTPTVFLSKLIGSSEAKALLKLDGQYGEHVQKKTLKTPLTLEKLRAEFLTESEALASSWKDLKDLRQHFIFWVNKQTVPAGMVYTGPKTNIIDHSKPLTHAK